MTKSLMPALTAFGLIACQPAEPAAAPAQAAASVIVTDAWCRPTPSGARAGACYVTLTARTADRLVGIATPAAATTQIHDMTTTGGVMRMSEMTGGLPLPAGEAVTLAPGGRHLMLTGLTGPLVEGTRVTLTLDFERAPDQVVQAVVRRLTTPARTGH